MNKSGFRKLVQRKIIDARVNAGLSKEELGKATQISPVTLHAYEKGKRHPSLLSMVSLCKFYKKTINEFLGM
jgi:DNA-binding XRE family transcriptional regulator